MILIPLSRGYVALVDDCDAHLAKFKWCADTRKLRVYAARDTKTAGRRRKFYLHREILGITDPGLEVDHRNGNGLDCRRDNLRQATPQQNQANVGLSATNTSGFKGVSWNASSKGWRAQIKERGRTIHVGTFATAEDAARAYDEAARRLHGEFAWLNFPRALSPASDTGPTGDAAP